MDYLASLQLSLPEEILTLGALALMLVAAWGGQRATRAGKSPSSRAKCAVRREAIPQSGPAAAARVAFVTAESLE